MTEFSTLTMTRIVLGRLFRWHKPFRYQKDYDNALRVLNVVSWYFLYHALEGPNAEQVCMALNKCMTAVECVEVAEEQLEDYKQSIGFKKGSILPKVMRVPKVQHLPKVQSEIMERLYQAVLSAQAMEKPLKHDLNVFIYGKDSDECGYSRD